MRFYTQQHRFYAGIDLHTRTLQLRRPHGVQKSAAVDLALVDRVDELTGEVNYTLNSPLK